MPALRPFALLVPVLLLLSVGCFYIERVRQEKTLDDVGLVAKYFPKAPDGSVSFDADEYQGGTAIIGPGKLAFWVRDGKAYAVNDAARKAAPGLPQAPESVKYDASFIDAAKYAEVAANTRADRALDDARRLAQEGKYEEALQKHIWYHKNALKIDDAQYGVRLSFALSYWVELGEKYPKALEELRKIRDKQTSRIMDDNTDTDIFHEVQSINEYLGDREATIRLFKHLDAANPKFAEGAFIFCDNDLVQAKEFDLARKYLTNPLLSVQIYGHALDSDLNSSWSETEPDWRESAEERYTDSVLLVLSILRESGDLDLARQVQAEALKKLDNPEIRAALNS